MEADLDAVREPGSDRRRGMIVVAHDAGPGALQGSFIISYPSDSDDEGQHVDAVSGVLEAMGWSVLASRCGRTPAGHVNTAALVRRKHDGLRQRLWLAKPVAALPRPAVHAGVLAAAQSGPATGGGLHMRHMSGQPEAR
ncbi:hypothetical protein [Lichenicola sp.]|uniref:hypothetical protein n=1 Tax=Lichenicola sp. TaxID=2804529 RepID=UPI003B00348F